MITKIGKKALLTLLFCTYGVYGSLKLEITNTLGIPLSSIQTNAPFFVVISMKGLSPSAKPPIVQSLDKLHIIGKRSETRTIENSNELETKLIYTVIAENPGPLSIGPAQSGIHSSDIKAVSIIEGSYDPRSSSLKPRYTLSIPKKSYFIGEKVPFLLRFSYQQEGVKLVHLETVHAEGIEQEQLNKGEAKASLINGFLSSLIEYQGYFIPKKEGDLILPPFRADYTTGSSRPQIVSPFFLFSSQPQTSAVYTKQRNITIKPLPPTDLAVAGVGEFSDYSARISSSEVPKGEALVLTLSLEGKAYFEAIKTPELNLPEGLRSYESKATVSKTAHGEKKEWEFIIQGLKEGDYTIPKQVLYYFNSKTESYEKVSTKELSLTIMPGAASQAEQKKELEPTSSQEKLTQSLEPVKAEQKKELELPWLVFLLLLAAPIVLTIIRKIYPFMATSRQQMQHFLQERWTLFQAYLELKRIERSHDITQLYTVIKKTVTSFLHIPEQATAYEIAAELEARGFSEAVLAEWNTLYKELIEYSSYAPSLGGKSPSLLLKSARSFIQHLKKGRGRKALMIAFCLASHSLRATESPFLETPVGSSLVSIGSLIPFVVWQLLVISLWWLCWYYLSVKRKRALIVTFFFLVLALAGWGTQALRYYYPTVYIDKEGTILYLGPDTSYAIREVLASGEKATVAEKRGLWYYIFSSKGNGWVKAEDVKSKQ